MVRKDFIFPRRKPSKEEHSPLEQESKAYLVQTHKKIRLGLPFDLGNLLFANSKLCALTSQ
jgi:hypothetical protein